LKVYISVFIVIFASVAVLFIGIEKPNEYYNKPGIIIDFGAGSVDWSEVDFSEYPDAISSMRDAADSLGFPYEVEGLSGSFENGAMIDIPWGFGLKKEGFRFVGWSLSDGGPRQYLPGDSFTVQSEDVVFYAVWVEQGDYIISFDNNGGKGSVSNVVGVGIVHIPSGDTLERAGYEFSGWSTTPGGTKEYNSGDNFDLREDTILYAVWSEIAGGPLGGTGSSETVGEEGIKEYTISYNSGGGGPVGVFIEVKGIPSMEGKVWSLWGVVKGKTGWERILEEPVDVKPADYSSVVWAYSDWDTAPSVGVDQTGVPVHGYSMPSKIVTLAPSTTETVASLGKSEQIIGTDEYSNYPQSILQGKAAGTIAVVGGYTNPSFEAIMKINPDMVFCDGAQGSHLLIADKLRNAGIHVVVMYEGENIDVIMNNLFIAGAALSMTDVANKNIYDINSAINIIENLLIDDVAGNISVMVSLSSVKSPYVAGSNTYINDIFGKTFGLNIFETLDGWVMVNSEAISKANPDVIIVISDGTYNDMYNNLSSEWKLTTAYEEGDIYLLSGSTMDLASRPGPRIAQATELIARILHSDSFSDGIIVPKWIDRDYTDYLTYTKNLGFDKV